MERVQYQLERSLPQLQLLDDNHVFTKEQLQHITSQRQLHESRLIRQNPEKVDFIRYADYEQNLSELIAVKAQRMDLGNHFLKQNDTYHSAQIISIWERLVTKFKFNVEAWQSYIAWANMRRMRVVVGRVYARALSLHPNNVPLWLAAANHELNSNSSTTAARTLLQQALRLNTLPCKEQGQSTGGKRKNSQEKQEATKKSKIGNGSAVASTSASTSGLLKLKLSSREVELLRLWVEYFRMELVFIERLRRRWIVLGIQWEGSEETPSQVDSDNPQVTAAAQTLEAEASPESNENEQSLLSQVPEKEDGVASITPPSKPNTFTKRTAAGIPPAQMAILRGSIPVYLIGNALKTLPPSLHFILLLSLLELFRNFPLADSTGETVSRGKKKTPSFTTKSGEMLRKRLIDTVYDALSDKERWGWNNYAPVATIVALRQFRDPEETLLLSEKEAARDAEMSQELQENTLLEKASKLRENFSQDSDGLLDLAEWIRMGRGNKAASASNQALRLILQLLEAALVDTEGENTTPSLLSRRLAQTGQLPTAVSRAVETLRPLCLQAPHGEFYTSTLLLLNLLSDPERSGIDEPNLLKYLDAVRADLIKEARKARVETGEMRASILRRKFASPSTKAIAQLDEATKLFPTCSELWRFRIEVKAAQAGMDDLLLEWRKALKACSTDEALWTSFLDWLDSQESKRWRHEQYNESVRETASLLSRNSATDVDLQPTKQAIHDLVVIRYLSFSSGKGLDYSLKSSFASPEAWLSIISSLPTEKAERVYRHLILTPSPSIWLSYLSHLLSKGETVTALQVFKAAKATLSSSDAHTLEKGWLALL